MFEASTVGAAGVAGARTCRFRCRGHALVAQERPAQIPLSLAQQRMWFLNQIRRESAAYNIPVAIRLSGDLDVARTAGGRLAMWSLGTRSCGRSIPISGTARRRSIQSEVGSRCRPGRARMSAKTTICGPGREGRRSGLRRHCRCSAARSPVPDHAHRACPRSWWSTTSAATASRWLR